MNAEIVWRLQQSFRPPERLKRDEIAEIVRVAIEEWEARKPKKG